MIGKIIGAVVLIAVIVYGYMALNQTTSSIESSPGVQQLKMDIQGQLKDEGLPPQPAPANPAE